MTTVTQPDQTFFVTGGTLPPGAASYVERQADRDLIAALSSGETCYVLNSRQMGKSSLCARTISRLRQAGVRTAFLDLTKFGGRNLTADQWYAALVAETGRELGMRAAFLAHWKTHLDLPAVQRLFGAISEVGLPASAAPLVVFIDEIDVTLTLPFSTDEFFAAIRECYVARSSDPAMNRLRFCLVGTAAPADLIQDTRISPFNIGRRIDLRDFTPAEAAPLAAGLFPDRTAGELLLARILHWTNGHPYLTQRLCRALTEALSTASAPQHPTSSLVDRLCSDLFFAHTSLDSDDNLAFVRNRLLKSDADLTALLDLYRQILSGKAVRDDDTNALCSIIKLSGIVRVEAGLMRGRNRIYERVFDRRWVEQHLPDSEARLQKAAYRAGLIRASAAAAVIVAIMSGLLAFALSSSHRADDKAREAQKSAEEAKKQQTIAERLLYKVNLGLVRTCYDRHDITGALEVLAETPSSLRGIEWPYLNRLCHLSASGRPNSVVLSTARPSHGAVLAVALLHDGGWIATANSDGTVELWDTKSGKPIRPPIRAHSMAITSIAASTDPVRVVTGSWDGTVQVWDAEMHHRLRKFVSPRAWNQEAPISSVAITSNGKQVISGSLNNKAVLWDIESGTIKRTFTQSDGIRTDGDDFVLSGIYSVALSDAGNCIVVGGPSKVTVYSITTGDLIATLPGHTEPVTSIAIVDQGRRIATCSRDKTVRLWDLANPTKPMILKGHSDSVNSVVVSPDGQRIITGSDDGTIVVWDANIGRELVTVEVKHPVNAVALSSSSNTIFCGSADGPIMMWPCNGYEQPIIR